jgi:DNA-binding transcriptional regulator YhcF (GntR family)
MDLTLRVDGRTGVPPYLQIAQQVRHAIIAGVLEPGDQLPTVKEIVAMITVNPNTVFKALRELEHEGLVEGRPGAGTFVLRRPPGPTPGRHVVLRRSLERWVAQARGSGMDDRAMEGLLRQVLFDLADHEATA